MKTEQPLSTAEVAILLGCDADALRYLVSSGAVPDVPQVGGVRLWNAAHVRTARHILSLRRAYRRASAGRTATRSVLDRPRINAN